MITNRDTPEIDRDFLLWFAGFFDADGCVGKRKKSGTMWGDAYFMDIRQVVPNNGEAVVKEIQKNLGGGIYYYEPKQENHAPAWSWKLNRRFQIKDLLDLIIPYLRVKKRRAIEIRDEISKLPRRQTRWGTSERIKIRRLLKEGKSYRDIEKATGRNRHSISRKVKEMWPELARPPYEDLRRKRK